MGIFTIISQKEIDDAIQRAVFELYTIPMTLEELLRCANSISGEYGIEVTVNRDGCGCSGFEVIETKLK